MGTRRGRTISSEARKGVATIRDVASRAGVSVATVSRSLNGIGPVRDETTRRVRAAVRALKYVPHAAARSLSIRRTHTLGILLPEVHGEFFSEVIRGIDIAARRHGYHILVSGSHSDAAEMSAMLSALRGRVDGLVVMSPDLALGPLSRALATETPLVVLNSAAPGRDSIRIDNYNGARAMTDHLMALGHRHIAFIRGPARNVDAAERLRGYRSALDGSAHGVRRQIEVQGDFTENSGHHAAVEILSMKPRPGAIFAANDAMAVGALRALREAGLHLPQEMALAGFDDVPIARYVTPQLTTVHVDIAELGRRAVEHLLAAIKGDAPSRKPEIIDTTLVIRESCGAHQPRRPRICSIEPTSNGNLKESAS